MNVLKIGAVWCNGCLVMRPRWAEIEKELSWLATTYIDFDTEPEKMRTLGISSGVLPVFIFFDRNGKEITRLTGEVEKQKLLDTILELKDR